MLLTRSRRQWLFGIGFVLLWMLIAILFWGMTEIERVDAPPGMPYFAISTCQLGPVEWVTIKAYDSAVTTGVVTSYSFDFHLPGIVCGVAWTLLSGWLLYLWWRRAVACSRVKTTICDACGYDLSQSPHDTCPECGKINIERKPPNKKLGLWTSHWYWLGLAIFVTGAIVAIKGPVQLLLITNMSFTILLLVLSATMALPMLGIGIFMFWYLIFGTLRFSGKVDYKGRLDTPRKRYYLCMGFAWGPMAYLLIMFLCGWGMSLYRPALYDVTGQLDSFIRFGAICLVIGIVAQVALTRRVRVAARRAGICFRCAGSLGESKVELCEDCQGRSP